MNTDEKLLCRLMFQRKVLGADGQAYEDLLTAVMTASNPNFTPVKPQGSIGDRKNDGYDKTTGHYRQVYAPEKPTESEGKAVAKLGTDFAGLKKHWDKITPIKSFSFAFNDKYNGSLPTLEAELAKLKTKHSLSKCDCFLAKDLEDIFFSLSDDQIFAIIGKPPIPSEISNVDFGILKEVINHLLNSTVQISAESTLVAPDFTAKIAFNGLSDTVAAFLNYGNYQSSTIDKYFALNSNFAKQTLRDKLNSLYLDAKKQLAKRKVKNKPDLVFFKLLEASAPKQVKPVVDAAIVVLAYFFETCDIFDDPTQGTP